MVVLGHGVVGGGLGWVGGGGAGGQGNVSSCGMCCKKTHAGISSPLYSLCCCSKDYLWSVMQLSGTSVTPASVAPQ